MSVAKKTLPTTQRKVKNSGFNNRIVSIYNSRKSKRPSFKIYGNVPVKLINTIKETFNNVIVKVSEEEYEEVTTTKWYKKIDKEISSGDIVRIFRKNKELSQVELSKKLGVTNKYLSDIETGRRNVSKKIALKLSMIFNRPAEKFLF